jgi:TusE/DsrC/DsvC family sulfur relay protein
MLVSETPVEVNERGFMIDPCHWSPGAARFLAHRQGLADWPQGLTNDHWRVIEYMRAYYDATGNVPSLRYTCRELGLTKRQLSRLFPGGLMTARRISGLPDRRRASSRGELSRAQRLLTGNWWKRLTDPGFKHETREKTSRALSGPATVRSGKVRQAMTPTQTPDLLQVALLHWIDQGMEIGPEPGRWPLETRPLRSVAGAKCREYIIAELWECTEPLPDAYCDQLEIPRGSTYGDAVRKIWREHLGEEEIAS